MLSVLEKAPFWEGQRGWGTATYSQSTSIVAAKRRKAKLKLLNQGEQKVIGAHPKVEAIEIFFDRFISQLSLCFCQRTFGLHFGANENESN